MSGFVGIFHRNGRPVDPTLLASLTEALRFRGPDGLGTWQQGSIGFGHARFTTHPARDGDALPLDLDGRYWITGHIRLDAREELIAALCHSERSEESLACSDAALVLRSFRAWGPDCVARIHGDFAFGIWDAAERRLFCARDRFGVRPLFYAEYPDLLLFGNTLDCLCLHPRVTRCLDEYAVADFLTCGYPLDAERTFFRDVRQVPAGHALVVAASSLRQHRYWSLPQDPYLRYRRQEQYVEQFADLLSRAVHDRAAAGPTAISLSGGLDSGAIGAVATGRIGGASVRSPLRACCYSMNRVFEDREPEFAQVSARALGLPLEVVEAEDDVPFKTPLRDGARPHPIDDFYYSETVRWQAHVARDARVVLDGQGGDEAFCSEWLLDEAARESWPRLARDALLTWATVRRPGLGLRARFQPGRGLAPAQLPTYFSREWSQSLKLRERLGVHQSPPVSRKLPRARARERLMNPRWQPYLESHDAGFTGVACENRWPYLDERIVRFALALPPFPWCMDKHLQRTALKEVLPDAITRRPKSPLAGQIFSQFLARTPDWHEVEAPGLAVLGSRVDPAAWQHAWSRPEDRFWWSWELARASGLCRWLMGLESRYQSARLDGEFHERWQIENQGGNRKEAVREARPQ